MFDDITTWLRAFFAIQSSAMEARGFVEVATADEIAERWPRTTGHDVIAIASLIDPLMHADPAGFGGHAIARRWRALADDLEAFALTEPDAEYVENRAFWRSLAAICVHLNAEGAPLPPVEVWDALTSLLVDPVELRNVGPKGDGPFKHFDNVRTFDELYLEQYKYLRDTRGADERAPEPGMGGTTYKIPRATNADVVALADYWSKQFADAKEIFGHKGAMDRWKKALADVDAIARRGDPSAVYPKNNGFWRDLKNTAIHIAVADEAPTKWDLAKEAIKDSIMNLPQTIKGGAKALGEAAGDLAHGAGKVVNDIGRGLFAGLSTPVIVGAGLVGLYLVTRNRSSESGQ